MSCEGCGGPLTKPWQKRFCGHKCRATVTSGARKIDRRTACKVCGAIVDRRVRTGGTGVVCSDACLRESRRLVAVSNVEAGKGPPRNVMTEAQRNAARNRLTGTNAPWWKGGRVINDAGYVLVAAPADYPFPQSVTAGRRIREHRMVMELHLGRALTRREVVHHINGDRADNRIENLEVHASHSEHMSEHAESNAARMRANSAATRRIESTCRTCGASYTTNARSTGECKSCRTVGYEAKRRAARRGA